MSVSILVVDPHPFFCEVLATGLDEDDNIDVIGWATSAQEAARLAEAQQPDVILCELGLASEPITGLLYESEQRSRLIVLTAGHEGDALLSVAQAGAAGCLSHETGLDDLRMLLTKAVDGHFVVDPSRLGDALRRSASSSREPGRVDVLGLTAREREILGLLTRGLDNPAIAKRLHLSVHTVRTHVGNVLRKLNVRSRAEAARVALQAGSGEEHFPVLRIEGPSLGER